MARAKFIPTREQKQLVEILCAMGVTQPEICKLIIKPEDGLPICDKVLRQEFRHELDTAELRANSKVAGALFDEAVNKRNVTAMIFWLKTRARWRETADLNVTHYKGTEEDAARAVGITQRLVAKLTRVSDSGT